MRTNASVAAKYAIFVHNLVCESWHVAQSVINSRAFISPDPLPSECDRAMDCKRFLATRKHQTQGIPYAPAADHDDRTRVRPGIF